MREGSKPHAETQSGSVHESPVRRTPHARKRKNPRRLESEDLNFLARIRLRVIDPDLKHGKTLLWFYSTCPGVFLVAFGSGSANRDKSRPGAAPTSKFRRWKPIRWLQCKSTLQSVGLAIDYASKAVDCLLAVPRRPSHQDTNCCRLLGSRRSKSVLLKNCKPRAAFSRANLAYPRPAALRSRGENSFTVKVRFISHPTLAPPSTSREQSRSSRSDVVLQ